MSGFQLDTSGEVYVQSPNITDRNSKVAKRWSNLTPFEQGYTTPILEEASRLAAVALDDDSPSPGFSDLAPETLARIIEDCAGFGKLYPGGGHLAGAKFWAARQDRFPQRTAYLQRRLGEPFPPLTVTLGDDGKVYLAPTVSVQS